MTDLRELWIDGFGCLRTADQPFRFERGRINLFVDDNETGKSTLLMALLAALYGVETDKRLRTSLRPHEAHWFPVGGPPFGVRLRLHDGRRLLEIRWNFANGVTVRVVDLNTNTDVTEEFCPDGDGRELGRRLLGLSIEEFAKTSLVRQDELDHVRDAKGIESLVQRAAGSNAGDTTVALAREKLTEVLRNYPGSMLKGGGLVETEIRRLEEDAEALRRKLAELDARRAAVADEDLEFQRLAGEREELRREAARLEYLGQVAEYDELVESIKRARECRATLDRLDAERLKLAPLENVPADRAELLTGWQAERLGLLRQVQQVEKSIAELRTHGLAPVQRELDAMGRLGTLTQDDLDAVTELLGKTRDFERREQGLLDAIGREEEQLAAQGASIEDLDRLEDRFADLEPADGELLTDQERAEARLASEVEEVKRRSLEATLRADRIMEARQRQREAAHRAVLTGLGVAAAGLLVGLLLIVLGKTAVGVVLLVLGMGAGAALAFRGQTAAAAAESLQGDELAEARIESSRLEERREQLAAEQRERAARLKSLARRFGYEQPDVLVEDYRSLDDLRRLCGTLILQRAQVTGEAGIVRQRETLEDEVAARFDSHGVPRPAGLALSTALEDLQDRMDRVLKLRDRVKELSVRLADKEGDREKLRQKASELTAQIRGVLTQAGIQNADSIEDALEQFDQRLADYQRLRQLTDDLCPQARANVVEPRVVEAKEAEKERLHRTITTQREQRPELLAVEANRRAAEYRQEHAEALARLEELRVKADEAGRHVVEWLRRYHAERPLLEEQLADREAHLARARRDRAALELARDVLDQIGLEVHGRWAEELNRSTSQLLERIAPSLTNLKFDSKLQFGVTHRGLKEPVRAETEAPKLSAGTWDQLYLAVRLGLAEFVAQRVGGGLLLLDDPFAHFDDGRFEKAIHVLSELALGRHQIVLFSCQRQRFEWLKSRNPKWFESHIARRKVAQASRP